MIKVECTWGDGPDVMVEFSGKPFILYEGPRNPPPPKGSFIHGFVENGSFDLTINEAEDLVNDLLGAIRHAKSLEVIDIK